MQNNQPKTPASSTVDAAMKAPHPGGGSDFGLNPEDAVSKVADKIQHATNILIALSKDPNVDEISAAIALAFVLDQQKKHVTAIYSGQTPNALEFLRPEETFQKDISGLQDFIIALNKSKADHLIYQVEGDYVKILITPYKGQIKKEDLEYSYSDYNVDIVIVFNVNSGSEIDSALSEYGRIMHDAMAINITSSVPGRFADLEWSDPSKSSVCEMVYDLLSELEIDNTPQEVATALLTGILSATERFSNNRTKPTTMAVASKLMEAGADQQLISSNILKAETPAAAAENPFATQSPTTNETPAAPVAPVAQETQEAPVTPTIQETPEASAAPAAQETPATPVAQETQEAPVAQVSPATAAATPEVSAASQDSTEAPQLTPEQELERMFEQNQASQSQTPTSGSSLPGNPMVTASNVMDDLARLTNSMLSAESPAVPNVTPVAPVEPIAPNIPAVPEVPVATPTIPVAPETIPVAPENSPAPNIPVAPETPTIPTAPAQPQYIQPQPMQYQSTQPQPVQYQSVQPQPQQYQTVQPQPEQIQPMPQMQAEYQPTPQFVQPAPQPVQPSFRPQPASNPEIYGHTIAEPVIDSGEDMSRLMDEALAEPSPIQNPIGYQGMINQSNYINQSLNQNTVSNYPLAVGQQPVTNYQQGQNLATLSAPTLPQMPQNQAYPNPEYSNVVPEYQTPAMPVLPEDPSQPAPQPVQPTPQPAPQSVQPTPQPIPQSIQPVPEPAQPQMQAPIQPVPEPIQSQQPMDSYIQTTPPATSTPIPDFLQPESFMPPAPAPVIIDQAAPPFMPPAMPTPPAIPQPTPQPIPQPTPQPVQPAQPQMQVPAQPVSAPAQPQMQAEVQPTPQPTPQPAQPQTSADPAANPVKADPSAFHIPGSY